MMKDNYTFLLSNFYTLRIFEADNWIFFIIVYCLLA